VAQYDRNNQIKFQKVSSVRHTPDLESIYDDYRASPGSDEKSDESLDAGLLRGGIKRTKVGSPTKTTGGTVVTKVKRTKIRRRKTKIPTLPSLGVLLDRPKLLAQLNAVLGDITAIAQNCV
jgi:hypothetical protein